MIMLLIILLRVEIIFGEMEWFPTDDYFVFLAERIDDERY